MAVSKIIIMQQKIQELKAMGLTKTEILRDYEVHEKVPPSWPTLAKYYNMEEEPSGTEAFPFAKDKVFDKEPYKTTIIEILGRNNKKLKMSSIFDVLIEKYIESGEAEDLPGNAQTLRNFVHYLRATDQVPEAAITKRTYDIVEEMPEGKQILVDFGEQKIEDGITIHFICLVLRCSRFLFVSVQDHKFNSPEACLAIYLCFKRIGGRVEQLVIDQDSVFIYQEKYGEIIETQTFRDFLREQELTLYVCRKADPESKGPVEKNVQFVKQNYFSARKLHTLQAVRTGINSWLVRKNARIHQTTLRIPSEELEIEKSSLKPLIPSLYGMIQDDYVLYSVKNSPHIRYRTNKYSIPHSYCFKTVKYKVMNGIVRIYDCETGKEIASHDVDERKGITHTHLEHKRPKSTAWMAAAASLKEKYYVSGIEHFINGICKENPRYKREQLDALKRYLDKKPQVDRSFLEQVIDYCCAEFIYSFTGFCIAYEQKDKDFVDQGLLLGEPDPVPKSGISVQHRSVESYAQAFLRLSAKSDGGAP